MFRTFTTARCGTRLTRAPALRRPVAAAVQVEVEAAGGSSRSARSVKRAGGTKWGTATSATTGRTDLVGTVDPYSRE